MMTDATFLAAVAASPADRTPRLAYADWLMERNDPRGRLIAVEEELRTLPVVGDEFWKRKAERSLLRPKATAGWLTALGYGTDYDPVFTSTPTDWRGRWRLIREFVARWQRLDLPDIAGRPDAIALAEDRLGYPLPGAAREWVAFANDLTDRRRFDLFRDVYQVRHLPALSATSLMIQAEGDVYWAFRDADRRRPDPPVWVYYEDGAAGFAPDRDSPTIGSVTEWVLTHLLTYLSSYHDSAGGFEGETSDRAALVSRLAAELPSQGRIGGIELFEDRNLLVAVYESYFVGRTVYTGHFWKPPAEAELPGVVREMRGG